MPAESSFASRRVLARFRGGDAVEKAGGCGAPPSRDQELENAAGLDDVAGGVKGGVRLAEGGDAEVGAVVGWAEADEEDLVGVRFDFSFEFLFELDSFLFVEVSFENGELEVGAVIFAGFENAPETFGVGDVVGDDVAGAHGRDSAGEEGAVGGEVTGEVGGEESGLEFKGAAV